MPLVTQVYKFTINTIFVWKNRAEGAKKFGPKKSMLTMMCWRGGGRYCKNYVGRRWDDGTIGFQKWDDRFSEMGRLLNLDGTMGRSGVKSWVGQWDDLDSRKGAIGRWDTLGIDFPKMDYVAWRSAIIVYLIGWDGSETDGFRWDDITLRKRS